MGGKAFTNTRRILKDEIQPTLDWLAVNWRDCSLNVVDGVGILRESLLGSAGKNPDSGDLDINLRLDCYDQDLVRDQMIALLGDQNVKAKHGTNQIFTSVPIKGQEELGRVQVDLMFGDYQWQKFSYFGCAVESPGIMLRPYRYRANYDTSNLKGLYRTELIKALVAFNSDWVLFEDGEVVARVGPTFFHDRGVVWRYRHRPHKVDGSGQRIKAFKELSRDEFKLIYPSALDARMESTTNVDMIHELVFDASRNVYRYNGNNLKDFNNFETIWTTMRSLYNREEIDMVSKIYLERLNSLKATIPTDVFRAYGVRT